MEVGDNDEEEEPQEQEQQAHEVDCEAEEEQELVTLTLNSKAGSTTEKSMKMRGQIKGRDVVVLIDSGATSNFIDEKLVQEMNWAVNDQREFGVRVGGGQIIRGRGRCTDTLLEIQGVKILEEFLVFDLGSIDVVLGFSWLATLGETRTNWGLLGLSWKICSY